MATTLKEFLMREAVVPLEKGYPTSDIISSNFDVSKPATRELINRTLDVVTSKNFITPYVAINEVAKQLAYYGIIVPRFTFTHPVEGEEVFKLRVPGEAGGQNKDGTFSSPVIKGSDAGDYYLFFAYSLNDEGFTEVYAEVVDSSGLQELQTDEQDSDYLDIEESHDVQKTQNIKSITESKQDKINSLSRIMVRKHINRAS